MSDQIDNRIRSILDQIDIDLSMTEDLIRLQRRVELYLFDLILFGCVADPIIYAARMRQVRSGYARIWNILVGRVARRRGVQELPMSTVRDRVRRRISNEAKSASTATGRRSNIVVSNRVTSDRNDVLDVSEADRKCVSFVI